MNIYAITDVKGKSILEIHGVTDLLLEGSNLEIKPKWDDLARLYILVRKRKPFQILEFGSGFSTIVMAYALKQNWEEYLESRKNSQKLAQPRIVSIESSKEWMQNTIKKIKKAKLTEFAKNVFSTVSIAEYQGQICHFYDELPDIVPDFVYLDGPDPSTVKGSINGLSFKNPNRTVMSGDILKYESTLLPGFFMIIDGRTNNARFLQRMLARKYDVNYHEQADTTTFELIETRLGIKNIFGWEAYDCDNNHQKNIQN